MGDIKCYRDLQVWQKAMDLTISCYRLAEKFPKVEIHGIADQLRRAAVSVPANIAEGHERQHPREFLQYLSVGYGSLAEIETLVQIAERLNYVGIEESKPVLDAAAEVGRMLNGLRKSLKDRC